MFTSIVPVHWSLDVISKTYEPETSFKRTKSMNNVQIRMLTKYYSGYVILKSNSTKNSKGKRLISHFDKVIKMINIKKVVIITVIYQISLTK